VYFKLTLSRADLERVKEVFCLLAGGVFGPCGDPCKGDEGGPDSDDCSLCRIGDDRGVVAAEADPGID
jgi:hypothetical protein